MQVTRAFERRVAGSASSLAADIIERMRALLTCLLVVASGCSVHQYTCNYGGHGYQVGDTWTDGCKSCRCPSEGSKSVWCFPLSCSDGSVDGGADADKGG
jgi:hypothetical protein